MVVHKQTNKQKFSNKPHKAQIINEARRGPRPNLTVPIILIILVAIVLVGIFSQGTFYVFENNVFNNWFTSSKVQIVDEGTPLVIVNGTTIYQQELDKQWNALPVQAKLQLSRKDLLTQLVQERLLLQKAAEENIQVSTKEVNSFIESQLQQSSMSMDDFNQLLQSQGTNIDDVRNIYRKQLTIAKLFDTVAAGDLNASEKEIEEYYTAHKEDFYREEQVTVRHILVQVNNNFNESEALKRVAEIENKLDKANNTNFCELVTNYTADIGSRDNCGEYTFARGVMVKEFEDAAFDMSVGERRTIKTSFGYHIILKEQNIPKGYLGLDDILLKYPSKPSVRQFIGQQISQDKAKKVFDSYVKTLEDEATITYINENIDALENTSTTTNSEEKTNSNLESNETNNTRDSARLEVISGDNSTNNTNSTVA